MSELPHGWAISTLIDAGIWGSGGTPNKSNQDYYENGTIPWLVIGDLNDGYVGNARTKITEKGIQNSSAKLIPVGTLLVAMYGSIGKLGITEIECATNQAIASCQVDEDLFNKKYLFYFLLASRENLFSLGKGGAQQNISQTVLKEFPVAIAPLNEQIRIADKLDSVLARVGAAQARLEKIPTLLKRFRQSVLAAASSGELTREWRERQNTTFPGLTWASAKEMKHEFVIPETWLGVSLGSLSEKVSVGHVGKTSEFYTDESEGIPFLRSQNVRPGRISKDGLAHITNEFHRKLKKSQLKEGDLLVVRVGANRGDACILPKIFEEVNCANIVFARPYPGLSPYFNIYFQSPQVQSILLEETVGGAQGVINTKSVQSTFVALPPIEEQKEIVRRVESLFALAETVEKQYLAAKQRLDRLTQSLLAKAFRGELIPQDPDDEPAAELLKRIQAERQQQAAVKPKRKAGARSSQNIIAPKQAKINTMQLRDAPENYLLELLDQLGGETHAEVLWKKSELAIDDFYSKLKLEMQANGIVEDKDSPDPALRKLKVANR